ncbi:MAG: phage tail protein [Bacteroidota bacterium]
MAQQLLTPFSFLVEWGNARIGFTSVTGLERTIEAIEYREGSSRTFSKSKIPGMETNSTITLSQGMMQGDIGFYEWLDTVQMNTIERRDVIIKLLNENLEPAMTWRLVNCFPLKYAAAELKADANEIAIKTLEIAHDGLRLVV